MLTLKLSDLRVVETIAGSRGNQPKYLYDGCWVKTDYLGYEGLSEVIASRLAESLGIPCVEYRPCRVLTPDGTVGGCISEDFTKGSAEASLGLIFDNTMPRDFNIWQLETTHARIEAVCHAVERFMPRDELLAYLNIILTFDAIIFNEDRHLYNIIFLVNPDGTLRRAPLFDNGAGLLSNKAEYKMWESLFSCVNDVQAKPFSTDFRKQVDYINSICGDPFKGISSVNIHTADLYDHYPAECVKRALCVLAVGLQKRGVGLSLPDELIQAGIR